MTKKSKKHWNMPGKIKIIVHWWMLFLKRRKTWKVSATGRLPFFWNVICRMRLKKCSIWLKRLKTVFMETVLLCLRHCICQTTVSMAVHTVRTIIKTNILPEKNWLRKMCAVRSLLFRIWVINDWHWKPEKTRSTIRSNTFLNAFRRSTALSTKTVPSAVSMSTLPQPL